MLSEFLVEGNGPAAVFKNENRFRSTNIQFLLYGNRGWRKEDFPEGKV